MAQRDVSKGISAAGDENEGKVMVQIFQDLDKFKAQKVLSAYGTDKYNYCVAHADKGDYFLTCSEALRKTTFDLDKRGEKFTVKLKNRGKDDASLESFIADRGLRVLVPLSTSDFKSLVSYPFFVGKMGRKDAIDILNVYRKRKSQCYLVRVSENAKGLVLSVTFNDPIDKQWTIRHYPIEKTPFGHRMPQQQIHFDTLKDLVDHTFATSVAFNDEKFEPYARQMESTVQVGEYYSGAYDTLEDDMDGGMQDYSNLAD